MAAYILVDIQAVHDAAAFDSYRQQAPTTVAQYGGEYLVIGGEANVLEGSAAPGTLVLIGFPDREHAENWWNSPEYAPFKALRQGSTDSSFVVMSGLA